MQMKPMLCGLQSFSRLVQKNHTFFTNVFEQLQFDAQSSATAFTLALPWPRMNHQPVEMTTQPLLW